MYKKLAILLLTSGLCLGQSPIFDAKYLIGFLDSDMTYAALIDKKINAEKGLKDQVFSIKLPLEFSKDETKGIALSNSIIHAKNTVAFSKDNKWMISVESKGSFPDSINKFNQIAELPYGQFLTVAALNDSGKITLKTKTQFKSVSSVAVDPSGLYYLVASGEFDKELLLTELDDQGKLTKLLQKPLGMPSGRIIDVVWHPSGDYFGFISETKEIGFVKVLRDLVTKKPTRLEMFGRTNYLGSSPAQMVFSGDYAIVLDKKKYTTDINELYLIKFNANEQHDHYAMSSLKTGYFIDALVQHSQSNITFFVSKETSLENANSPCKLIGVKPNTEHKLIEVVNQTLEHQIAGAPCFDKTGLNMAIPVYEYRNFGKKIGGIDFYTLSNLQNPIISKQKSSYILNKGTNAIYAVF